MRSTPTQPAPLCLCITNHCDTFFPSLKHQPKGQEAPCSSLRCLARVIGLNSLSPPLRRFPLVPFKEKHQFLILTKELLAFLHKSRGHKRPAVKLLPGPACPCSSGSGSQRELQPRGTKATGPSTYMSRDLAGDLVT